MSSAYNGYEREQGVDIGHSSMESKAATASMGTRNQIHDYGIAKGRNVCSI